MIPHLPFQTNVYISLLACPNLSRVPECFTGNSQFITKASHSMDRMLKFSFPCLPPCCTIHTTPRALPRKQAMCTVWARIFNGAADTSMITCSAEDVASCRGLTLSHHA